MMGAAEGRGVRGRALGLGSDGGWERVPSMEAGIQQNRQQAEHRRRGPPGGKPLGQSKPLSRVQGKACTHGWSE